MADVVVEVELRVVDPYGASLAVGDEAELSAKAGDEVKAGGGVGAELVVGGRRPFEDRRGRDVHVGRALLHVQERGVEPAEAIAMHRR